MKIIIETGFSKITHSIKFDSTKIANGTQVAKAHHVREAKEHQENGKNQFIEANVVKSCTVSGHYKTILYVGIHYF